MKFYKKIFAIPFLLILLFAGCRKDVIIDEETPGIRDKPNVLVEAGLLGRVFDENSEPVLNASVELAGQLIETDSNGVFFFNHLDLNEAGDFVKVEKSGYFLGSHRFYPTLGNENYVEIKLLPKILVKTIDATNGGTAETSDGAIIELPAGGIVDADGNTFTGEVNVFAHRINPVADDLHQIMPGSLEGQNTKGINVALETYGMLAVELESTSGAPLNLGNDKKAKLTFPVPAELQSSAPIEIPLWSLDETNGVWEEEGKAIFDGNSYSGEVTHFTFWGACGAFELVRIEGCFVDDEGNPLPNRKILIINKNTNGGRFGWTNSEGCFAGNVPIDGLLNIQLISSCPPAHFAMDIGPFSEYQNLGTIEATGYSEDIYTVNLKGRAVDCDGAFLDDVVLIVNADGKSSYFSADGTGFSILAEFCPRPDSISMTVYSSSNGNYIKSLTNTVYTDSLVFTGDLALCETDVEFVEVTVGNETKTFFGSTSAIVYENSSRNVKGILLANPAAIDFSNASFQIWYSEGLQIGVNQADSTKIADLNLAYRPGNDRTQYRCWHQIPSISCGNISTDTHSLILERIGVVNGYVTGELELDMNLYNLLPDGQVDPSTILSTDRVKFKFSLLRII